MTFGGIRSAVQSSNIDEMLASAKKTREERRAERQANRADRQLDRSESRAARKANRREAQEAEPQASAENPAEVNPQPSPIDPTPVDPTPVNSSPKDLGLNELAELYVQQFEEGTGQNLSAEAFEAKVADVVDFYSRQSNGKARLDAVAFANDGDGTTVA